MMSERQPPQNRPLVAVEKKDDKRLRCPGCGEAAGFDDHGYTIPPVSVYACSKYDFVCECGICALAFMASFGSELDNGNVLARIWAYKPLIDVEYRQKKPRKRKKK